MKKWMSILVAALLVFSMTAYAAVPSKTTTNAATVVSAESATGVEVAPEFSVAVTEDAEAVTAEITKIFNFVTEGNAPVAYFPTEVIEKIAEKIADVAIPVATLEINEFVTIDETAYTESYGDMKVSFSFTTVYKPSQKLVALVGIFTGEVDANGEAVVEWIAVDAAANEDGTVAVSFPAEVMLKIQSADSVSLAIVSTAA